MKALAVLGFLLGVMTMLLFATPDRDDDSAAMTVATNYAVYRNAALLYVFAHKPTGSVPLSALTLPTGWNALHVWQTRVEGGICYVFGPASAQEIEAVRGLFNNSVGIGRADSGVLVPGEGAVIPVPAFVPHASLVSVLEVN